MCLPLNKSCLSEIGIGLDFNEPVGIGKARHLHHRRHRANLAKKLTMHLPYTFPVCNAREKNTCTDHVGEIRSQALQGHANDFQTAPCLGGRVTWRDRFAIRTGSQMKQSGAKSCSSSFLFWVRVLALTCPVPTGAPCKGPSALPQQREDCR